ncbi:MAG TPA: nucleoside-diphosphate sugar epimerase/dehydratase [Acidimicrobiales bacterium]|nr:nucleoside-diphosphate sugar epimerase/dehydratase [Acidimicrobiales bacterium]
MVEPGRRSRIAHWFATSRLFALVVGHRFAIESLIDAGAWIPAVFVAVLVRFEMHFQAVGWPGAILFALLTAVAQLAFGLFMGLYSGRTRYGTFDELPALTASIAGVVAFSVVANTLWLERLVPNGTAIAAGPMALGLMVAVRYLWRLLWESRLRPTDENATPVLVFGAGSGGDQLLTAMLRDPGSALVPVGLLDDDPRKSLLRLRGVPVLGNRNAIPKAVEATGARMLVIAVPSADAQLVRDITSLASAADLEVRTLPPVNQLLGTGLTLGDVRPVTDEDLLGRHPVDTDVAAIAGYLTGRRVLVTGAGGSIGSELCRQIARFSPSALVMLDRDESLLHALQLSLDDRALLDTDQLVVADIRDRERMREVFGLHQPEVVFHAAALKHLTLLERNHTEAWKTNVVGSQNVLEAALVSGVDRFVNISTDKAAEPVSVLGYSKRIAERLTAAAADICDGTYLSVRFGNVLGSRGSVLTAFRHQIDRGGPVTVTHPEVTRFFMTVQEACQLVIQAGAIGRSGEVLVLDMGVPVRIVDVARQMIEASGRPEVEIEFSGLRPGEKLHEVLASPGEEGERPFHPLVSHSSVPPLTPDAVSGNHDNDSVLSKLQSLGGIDKAMRQRVI